MLDLTPWDQILEQCFLIMYHVPGVTWGDLQNMEVKDRLWLFQRTKEQLEKEVKAIKKAGEKGKRGK